MGKGNFKGYTLHSDGSIRHFDFVGMTLAAVKKAMQVKYYDLQNSPMLMGITEVATGRSWSKMYSFDNWKQKRF